MMQIHKAIVTVTCKRCGARFAAIEGAVATRDELCLDCYIKQIEADSRLVLEIKRNLT
jgi:hypothetical protein